MKIVGLNPVSSVLLAAIAAAFGLVLAAGFAPAAAQGTPEQRQACQPDALRLCGEFVPDVDRITACMVKNRIRLSPPCRAVFTAPRKSKSFKPTG
jgi:hypothetical protein